MPSDRDFSTCLCLVSTSPEVKCWIVLVFKMILVARKSLGFEQAVEWLLGFFDFVWIWGILGDFF